MSLFSIFGISLGLSLDAFTVALTNSTVIKDLHLKHGLRMSFFFGFFQFMMPIIGWAAGMTFSVSIKAIDHWIAFSLLFFVGGRMLLSSLPFRQEKASCTDENKKDCRDLSTLLLLSIATSIDALAIGLTFAMIDVNIIYPSVMIGITTFIMSILGYGIGRYMGMVFKVKLDILGGIVLIGIGIKILIGHLVDY